MVDREAPVAAAVAAVPLRADLPEAAAVEAAAAEMVALVMREFMAFMSVIRFIGTAGRCTGVDGLSL